MRIQAHGNRSESFAVVHDECDLGSLAMWHEGLHRGELRLPGWLIAAPFALQLILRGVGGKTGSNAGIDVLTQL